MAARVEQQGNRGGRLVADTRRIFTPQPMKADDRLVDQFGAPFGPPVDPLRDVDRNVAANVIRRDNPIVSLNEGEWGYEAVRATMAEHGAGQFMRSAMLWDAITGDDRVSAVLSSRVGALFGLPVVYTESKKGDASLRKPVLEAWKNAYPKLAPRSVASDVKQWALGLGFGVSQVVWDTDTDDGLWQPYLRAWHPAATYFDWQTRQLVAMTQDGPVHITPGDGNWFVHAPWGVYRGWLRGAIRPLSLPWLLRDYASRDWARYNERHGMPIIKAYVPAVGDADEKEQFGRKLANMGREAVILCPTEVDGEKYDATLLEAMDRAWESFKALIDRSDMAITLTLAWQNLTTEIKEGSQAAAREHGDVKQTALEFDDAGWDYDVESQLARPFAAFNFGDAELAPRTHYDVEPLEDQAVALTCLVNWATAVKTLREAGQAIDVQALAIAYRVRVVINVTTEARVAQIFAYHLTAGVITVNEVRKTLGLNPTGNPADDELRALGPGTAGDVVDGAIKEAA